MPRDRPIIALALALLVASCASPPRARQAARPDHAVMPEPSATDADLAATVQRALGPGLAQVDVRATEGIVELRGRVPHLWAAERASRVARSIAGVRAVSNQIVVEPVARTDREIADGIERVLRKDPFVDADAIDLEVESGRVTLRGTVDSAAKRELVQRIAMSIRGAREVEDLVVVAPVVHIDAEMNRANVQLTREVAEPADVPPEAIAEAVVDAMRIDPRVDHRTIDVAATGSIVRLSGTAPGERARRVAEELARSTFGVSDVGNDIVVPAADRCGAVTRRLLRPFAGRC